MKGIIKIATLALSFFVLGLVQAEGKELYKEGKTNFPRKALVQTDCVINQFVNVVDVISGSSDMNNLMDDNLTNYATISGTAMLGLVEDPVVQIKDRKYYYAEGTKAGFCVQAGGSNSILSLDVAKHITIAFYKDGEMVGDPVPVEEGQSAGALGLDLIQIPGDEEAASFLSATAPGNFDEIALLNGGITAGVLSDFKIRYAFVGDAEEYTLTENNFPQVSVKAACEGLEILSFWTNKNNIINGELTDCATQVSVVGAGVSYVTLSGFKKQPAGVDVGFKFEEGGGKLGRMSIILEDDENNDRQEVDLQGSVLGLNVGVKEHKVAVTSEISFNRVTLRFEGVDVAGGRSVYYAFITEPAIVPEHTDLGLSMDASICGSETTYQLSPTEGINWEFVKVTSDKAGNYEINLTEAQEENIKITNGLVTGIPANVKGYYHFKATRISDDAIGTVILQHGVQSQGGCNEPVTTGDGYESAPPRGLQGGITTLNSIKNRDNVVDADPDNYAEIEPGISLISNGFIVGVHNKDGNISDGTEPKRIGFLADIPTNLLNLNLLQFFTIKLYDDGELTGSYSIENWSVISAGLIGSENASKTRLGVTVPVNVKFDEFSLWTGGVGSIRLSSMRIYSAFVENESAQCDNPLAGCDDAVILGDGALDEAYINYNRTGRGGVANVLTFVGGLEHLVSGEFDPEKYAYVYSLLSVGGSTSISIKFGRTLTANHQVGFVVDRETFLLGADVIGVTQINSYYSKGINPDKPVETKSDWSVLGADVIGYGDYAYLMFNATQPFDEIQFISAAGVGLSNSTKIYSVFVRTDADGDGIPDCMDPTPCDGDISNKEISSGVCTGDEIILSGIANFKEGETVDYKVEAIGSDKNNSVTISDSYTVGQGTFKLSFKIENAGHYNVQLTSTEGDVIAWPLLTVHPRKATWKGTSNDWNNWSNWDNGAPWSCTNVIIPSNASTYPELVSTDFNPCNYIHFEPHAEVVNTPYLTYNKAWVEIELKPNRYYMVATPIKGIYSGDWFISKEGTTLPDYFTDLTEENYPANRVTPTIYQRLWEHTAQNKLATGGDGPVAIISETKWTAPYNHMATSYEKRSSYDFNALSVWVHPDTPLNPDEKGDGSTYTFRFPKMHTTYFYSDMDGDTLGLSNNLTRKATAGRFIYEAEDGTAQFPITMTYQNEIKTNYEDYPNHQVFLVGNPFMSHIDIQKFFDKNDHIKSIKVESTDGNYSSVVQNDNTIIAGSGDTKLQYIPPMQSFFVELSSTDEYNDECEITYTEDILTQQKNNQLRSASSSPSDAFYLSASASGQRSSAMLRFSASASDYYHEGEDADILIDDEVPPAVAIFTVADSHALDIQQRASGGDIPIGFVLPKADEVTLRIDVPEEYAGWVLNDLETGKNYALRSGTNELELGRMLTNVGRFSLRGSAPTGNEVISASQPRIYCFREEGGNTLVVRSAEGMMTRCEIYTLAGQLSGVASYETNEYRLPVPPGIKIVKMHFTDGITSTIKTY